MAASPEDPDQDLAANAVAELVDYDYVFTRDTLFSLSFYGAVGQQNLSGYALQTAEDRIYELMRDRLTTKQVADFQAHAKATDPDWELVPPRPE